ncbi:MAG: PD-(D/E)XK nuclease family protein [Candidatus Taylorbacteria bacterium]|nr:PD-(D/E)XK nuclease family protein [Candidatus Taylorbacteria bacterium]
MNDKKMSKKAKPDRYSSVWVSHSSMGDFLKCPRAYFLKNIYKDPKTGRKIGIVNPALTLGVTVHEVVEGLGKYKAEDRALVPMLKQFEEVWKKFSGKKGGFMSTEEEETSKQRGISMIEMVREHMGQLLNKTVKLPEEQNGMPPNYYLSEDENIILCGKIDWLEYLPDDDSLHVIDFKTGQNEEKGESLQLPIYELLLHNLQKRKVTKASYWYLDKDTAPKQVNLPNLEESFERVISTARKVKEAREKKEFECTRGEKGCFACAPLEKIIKNEAEYVGRGEWQDLYIINS